MKISKLDDTSFNSRVLYDKNLSKEALKELRGFKAALAKNGKKDEVTIFPMPVSRHLYLKIKDEQGQTSVIVVKDSFDIIKADLVKYSFENKYKKTISQLPKKVKNEFEKVLTDLFGTKADAIKTYEDFYKKPGTMA